MLTITEMDKELTKNREMETATFGMGCFWGPEARFGSLEGVIRTRVGYAGGTTVAPTYKTMGDHTETVEIDYDSKIISYEEILLHFWRNHYPNRDQYKGQQYVSSLRYHNYQQERIIIKVKSEMEKELGEQIETEITQLEQFTLAEARHQKYYLKRYPNVLQQLHPLYTSEESLIGSTFAARLNGFVKGFSTRDQILTEIESWPLHENAHQHLIRQFLQIKW